MTERDEAKRSKGCLGSVALLFGLLWIGLLFASSVFRFDGGGFNFESTRAFLPILFFFVLASVLRRRAGSSSKRSSRPPQTLGRPPVTRQGEKKNSAPAPTPPLPPGSKPASSNPLPPPPSAKTAPRSRPIPELPPVEPVHEPGELPAVEALEIEDFLPTKPLSSEERLQMAREKFLKKRD